MDIPKDDAFGKACQCLERISELKEKNVLEDAEYQELRNVLVSEMKRLVTPAEKERNEQAIGAEVPPSHFLPYGQLHAQIVNRITAGYRSPDATQKQRMFRAMSEMAAKQALYRGDSAALEQLVEIVCTPLDDYGVLEDNSGNGARKLLQMLKDLNDISTQINDAPDASPAAKAIAQTAQQSANQAAEEFGTQRTDNSKKNTTLTKFWSRLVLQDVEGAFEGGVAAVSVYATFAAAFPWPLPIAAAFGVVVSAGVRSAVAYCEADATS